MGLLDFIFGKKKKPDRELTSTENFGDYNITTSVKVTTEWVDDDSEYIEPPDTLRELKAYSENVPVPCGFDFSAVRRHKGSTWEWWLDGSNFDRAIGYLHEIEKFEDEARGKGIEFPHACSFIAKESRPYAKGADGNIVPTITKSNTKSDGPCVDIRFRICKSNKTPLAISNMRINENGNIKNGSVTFFEEQGAPGWRLHVSYRKKLGKTILTSVSFDDIEMLDEKVRARQLKEREEFERQLSTVDTVEKITAFAMNSLDIADKSGLPTDGARKALTEKRWESEFTRERNEMRLFRKKGNDGGMVIVTSDGRSGRLRYWTGRGAPEIEYDVIDDELGRVRVRGERIDRH